MTLVIDHCLYYLAGGKGDEGSMAGLFHLKSLLLERDLLAPRHGTHQPATALSSFVSPFGLCTVTWLHFVAIFHLLSIPATVSAAASRFSFRTSDHTRTPQPAVPTSSSPDAFPRPAPS